MNTNKKKLLSLVTEASPATVKAIEKRYKKREVLKESQLIAYKILLRLSELNWSQKDLAAAMEVTPQQVNKIMKGEQNLTLETQIKLQKILNIPILASYYEERNEKTESSTRDRKENVA